MYKHKSMKETSTQAHSDKKRRAKERLLLKMQGRNAAEKAPGIGVMLPGKVRRSRKYEPRYEFSESVPDLEHSDELLIDTSSPVKERIHGGIDGHSTRTSMTNMHGHRPRKRSQLADMIPMQSLIDKIIARRQITDRYLDDRYRRYRGRPSEEDKTPMMIRSYRQPEPPFAIQNNPRVRKFVFISPRRDRDRIITGPTSSIVVIEKPSPLPLLERDEDKMRQQKWNNRTQELDVKTWKPNLEYLHRHHVHPAADREDRHVRNYKLERQLGMKMEGQGMYSDSHLTTQARVLPPIRIPCQPIFGDRNHEKRGELTESRKSTCSSARSSKRNITLGDIDVVEKENAHRNEQSESRTDQQIEYTKSGETSRANEDLILEIKGEEIKKNDTKEKLNSSGDESKSIEHHKMEVRIPMGVPRVPTNTPDLPGEEYDDEEEEGDDINRMETANRPKCVTESEKVDNNTEVDNNITISVITVVPFDNANVVKTSSDSNNNSDSKPTVSDRPPNESELGVPTITMTCATPIPGTISRTNTPAPPVSPQRD
ncbi:uncharacterized protein LOC102800890 [Saccoglossus kowalevskii]|uniref:Uncharacterized protein LOC102800890 n=1 Tax=Saccoglossus kowalevskii TaxID=10224 RepID=A0ABM0MLT2_SACKO|nr:PREDICTED: uncharacterized protein LOC102800890 [Saccoglossus kowalevskii]